MTADVRHFELGVPHVVYEYGPDQIVCRWDFTDGRAKELRPAVRGPDGWQWRGLPEPRPLYRLRELVARPDAQVLIVEGEKCADVAAQTLPSLVCVSWCGGGRAVAKSDWTPLAGRKVVIWPDNDDPGAETAVGITAQAWNAGAVSARIIRRPGPEAAKGWDIADAVAEGWDAARIVTWAKARAVEFTREDVQAWKRREVVHHKSGNRSSLSAPQHKTQPALAPIPQARAAVPSIPLQRRDNITALPGVTIPTAESLENWRANLLLNADGIIKPRLSQNFKWMLRCHSDTAGLFAWNEIAEAVFLHRAPPWSAQESSPWKPRRLLNNDIFETTTWFERRGMTPRKNETADTIYDVSSFSSYNPVKAYLSALVWDQCPRLAGGAWEGDTVAPLSTEYLGTPDDPIYGRFMVMWHVAAVARIMRPGCQVDNMIVLESPQGRRKSSYVRAMSTVDGIEYFCDDVGDISNKDSIIRLHGCWLVEIAELAKVRHADIEVTKSWVTRRSDRYRPPYEREVKDVPRHFVLAASVNPSGHGYLRDPTGNRRFWPVPICATTREIDIDRIARDRDQIWAEAVAYYRRGMKWYATRDEELRVDELTGDRRAEDPWAGKLDRWLADPLSSPGLMNGGVTLDEVIQGALGVPIGQQNEWTAKRVVEHLREAGLERARKGKLRVWRRPKSTGAVDGGIDPDGSTR